MREKERKTLGKAIEEQRELMMDDASCILDGIEDRLLTNIDQMICDRMRILLLKLEK